MILITHIDLDGVGCEIVARCFFSELTQIYHLDYDKVDSCTLEIMAQTSDNIIMTDVSVRPETAAEIASTYPGRLELFDHHKTTQLNLANWDWVTVDTTRSATRLLFDSLCQRYPQISYPELLQQLVFHINDYDLWLHTSPDSQKYNDLLFLLGLRQFADTMLTRLRENVSLISADDQRYLNALTDSKQKYFSNRVKTVLVDGNRILVVASRHISELSQYIRDITPVPAEWAAVDYIDILNIESTSHSLRSYNPDFDVSELAQKHGGGGHPRAAGYPMAVSPELLLKL